MLLWTSGFFEQDGNECGQLLCNGEGKAEQQTWVMSENKGLQNAILHTRWPCNGSLKLFVGDG